MLLRRLDPSCKVRVQNFLTEGVLVEGRLRPPVIEPPLHLSASDSSAVRGTQAGNGSVLRSLLKLEGPSPAVARPYGPAAMLAPATLLRHVQTAGIFPQAAKDRTAKDSLETLLLPDRCWQDP